MPDEVTNGELARGIAEIKRRLDTDAQAAATRERLYVLQAVYDEFKAGQAEKFKTVQGDITELRDGKQGIAGLWTARAEDSKSRRSSQVALAIALLASFVNILIAFFSHFAR